MTGTITVTTDVNELTSPTTRKQGRQPRQTETQILRQELAEAQEVATGWHNHLIAAKQEVELLKAEHARQLADKDDYIAERAQAHLKEIAERAQASLKELEEEKKQHGWTKINKDSYYRQNQDLEKELNGMHEILDLLPFAPPRKYKDRNDCDQERSLTVRFSTMVAIQAGNKS